MSDYQQARPFPATLNAPAVAPTVAPATVLLTLPNLDASLGGPPIAQVTLFAFNADTASAQVLEVSVQGQTLELSVPAGAVVKVFDAQPFVFDSATSGQITVLNATGSADLAVWGSFFAA